MLGGSSKWFGYVVNDYGWFKSPKDRLVPVANWPFLMAYKWR